MPLPLCVGRRARAEPYFGPEIGAQLPKGRAHLRNQLERSATSIVANIAEGAGEFSPSEKARFYRMARRSAIETAAWIETPPDVGKLPSP